MKGRRHRAEDAIAVGVVLAQRAVHLVTTKKAFANLATVMPNSSPPVTPVWFDFDGKYLRVVGTH